VASLLGSTAHLSGCFPLPGIEEKDMKFTQRTRGIVKAIAVVLSLALPVMLAISAADARVGGGGSSGSRGTRTFSAPPSTSTAPSAAQPFNRAPPAKAIDNERLRCHNFFIRPITRDNISFTSKDADKDGGVID